MKVTDASVRESVMFVNLHLRDEDTNQIGTKLSVGISEAYDEWLAAHDAEVARKTLEGDIYAHTAAGYVQISVCPVCSEKVQVDRISGEFVGHDISPLLRAVCRGSADLIASISTDKAGTGDGHS